MTAVKVISIASPGIWRLTVNGRVLGDGRGYDKAGA